MFPLYPHVQSVLCLNFSEVEEHAVHEPDSQMEDDNIDTECSGNEEDTGQYIVFAHFAFYCTTLHLNSTWQVWHKHCF